MNRKLMIGLSPTIEISHSPIGCVNTLKNVLTSSIMNGCCEGCSGVGDGDGSGVGEGCSGEGEGSGDG